MQPLDYATPPTTRRDTQVRRGRLLLLLGYLPAAFLFAMMLWYFIMLISLGY